MFRVLGFKGLIQGLMQSLMHLQTLETLVSSFFRSTSGLLPV